MSPPARTLRSAPVLLLAATGFAIGSTEFLAVGVVPQIAHDLHVSTGAAGLTVSLYAVGVALTTIPMTVAFGHRRPRGVVAAMVCLFALAHGVMAIAPSLPVLLAGRILAATSHGLAMGLAMTTAAAIVAPADRGRAVASVLGGLLTAMFLGAPLGTWLSDLVGWRVVFAGLGVAALVLAALMLRVVPDVPGSEDSGWSSLRPLRQGSALRPMGLTVAILAGGSILFAYLGAYLHEVTALPPSGVALGLAAFGGAGIAGNALGGRMAGRGAERAKLVALWILPPAVLVAGVGGHLPVVVLGALVVWSVAELSIMPVLAHQAIEAAGSVAGPVQNAAANAGIAIGGLAGAGVVAAGGVEATPYAGAAVLAAVALWVTVRQTVAKDLARSRRERIPSLR